MREQLPKPAISRGGYWVLPLDVVYEHLICEFSHYDVCLSGLIRWGFGKAYVRAVHAHSNQRICYVTIPITLDVLLGNPDARIGQRRCPTLLIGAQLRTIVRARTEAGSAT